MKCRLLAVVLLGVAPLLAGPGLRSALSGEAKARTAHDWPMFGGTPSRNMVNLVDKDPPTVGGAADKKLTNVRWMQATGNRGYCSPVIAGGRVFVSTNNRQPRNPKDWGPDPRNPKKKIPLRLAVIMCFGEKDGKFLYQVTHPMAPPPVDQQAKEDGMCSTPTVVGERFYYVTPGAVVVCADVKDGKAVWSYDLMKELNVFPCILNSCSPLVVGDTVYVVTGNGADPEGAVAAPKAPSFVALHKKDGKLKWQNNLPGANIIHGQWGNPAWAEAGGRPQVLFPGGDGYLYSLAPATGELLWKFQCSPAPKGGNRAKSNYPIATPVVVGNRAYLGIGAAPESGFGNDVGHFWCIDITKKGDVSSAPDNFDPKSPANAKSALVWHYGGKVKAKARGGRSVHFGPTIATAAVQGGLLYLTEAAGYLHCLDAATGQKYWEHDFRSPLWGSAYWVGGKVYIGSDDGEVNVFAHGKQLRPLAKMDLDESIQSTPVVANGTLYVTTKSRVYAIGGK